MLSSWTQLPVHPSPSEQTSEPNQEQVGALALALQASLAAAPAAFAYQMALRAPVGLLAATFQSLPSEGSAAQAPSHP